MLATVAVKVVDGTLLLLSTLVEATRRERL